MLLSIRLIIFDEEVYREEFAKYNVYENLAGVEVNTINKEVLDYFKGNGEIKTDFFSAREKEHLLDVKKIITLLSNLIYLLIPLIISLSLILDIIVGKQAILKFLTKIFIYSKVVVFGASIFLILAIWLNFAGSFDFFHQMFFTAGSWLFEPSLEKIVVLYPVGLFLDFGVRIIFYNVGLSVLAIAVDFGILWLLKMRAKNFENVKQSSVK